MHNDVANSIFFLNPTVEWKIFKDKNAPAAGYILYLSQELLNNPLLGSLHINEVRLFSNNEIPKINLAPGIEKRTLAILEMLDELVGSNLNNKEAGMVSLVNTFFVYCDGQCNIKSIISDSSTKKALVYRFKKLIDEHLTDCHDVKEYADRLNVSTKYLNECVQEVLNVNAKRLIIEQLIMRSRHELKFSTKTIKEVCFDLGFSSPDYFSYFLKNHTGHTPSSLREA